MKGRRSRSGRERRGRRDFFIARKDIARYFCPALRNFAENFIFHVVRGGYG